MILSLGKLLRTLPSVLLPKIRYPARAMIKHATMLMLVDQCVTLAKRSSVGFRREPYMRRLLWWQTNAKEMTPMAWKTPELIRREPLSGPFRSELTRGPWVRTVTRITSMLIRARVDAFAS